MKVRCTSSGSLAARFTQRFRELVEGGYGLDALQS